MKVCVGCVYEFDWTEPLTAVPEGCKGCEMVNGKPTNYIPKPQTRADRIRAMSDEELAKFICQHCDCVEGNCPGVTLCRSDSGTANGVLAWLKQSYEGEL